MSRLANPTTMLLAALCGGCDKGRGPPPSASVEAGAARDAAAPAPSPTVIATVGADAGPPAAKGPAADLNVIVLSIDSLRADMPWAGYPRPIAPRLTEL